MSLADNLTDLLSPIVLQAGFVLEEVSVIPVGKRRLISVVVDREKVNPSLDEVTVVSKEISAILDNYSQLGEMPFTLEVTTPGVDRPLTLPRHWHKNIGRLVKITPTQGEKYVARIKDFKDDVVDLEKKNQIQSVPLSQIATAQIEVEFNRKEVK
jgi:ribosome maturation factor RimP